MLQGNNALLPEEKASRPVLRLFPGAKQSSKVISAARRLPKHEEDSASCLKIFRLSALKRIWRYIFYALQHNRFFPVFRAAFAQVHIKPENWLLKINPRSKTGVIRSLRGSLEASPKYYFRLSQGIRARSS